MASTGKTKYVVSWCGNDKLCKIQNEASTWGKTKDVVLGVVMTDYAATTWQGQTKLRM